jgi:hypothetical protein
VPRRPLVPSQLLLPARIRLHCNACHEQQRMWQPPLACFIAPASLATRWVVLEY